MLRLVKYLKPYMVLIVITVVLLFVQANADLALPDYMSNIVNYGIQQGGVVNAVPMAIRQSEMNRVLAFMTADNQKAVMADYTLVDKSSADYATDVKLYPVLANEPVYVLNKVDQAEIDKLQDPGGYGCFRHAAKTPAGDTDPDDRRDRSKIRCTGGQDDRRDGGGSG